MITFTLLLCLPAIIVASPFIHPQPVALTIVGEQNLEKDVTETTTEATTTETVKPYGYGDDQEEYDDDIEGTTQPPYFIVKPTRPVDTLQQYRQRLKEKMLKQIKAKILNRLGIKKPPSPRFDTSRIKANPNFQYFLSTIPAMPSYPKTITDNVLPSCLTPRNTADRVWHEEFPGMRLYYDMSKLKHEKDIRVEEATLKLLKKPLNEEDESDIESLLAAQKIRVTVYRYRRALRFDRVRRLLEDSVMLSADESGWIQFDLRGAVQRWIDSSKKNYGLEIRVEDQVGKVLDASRMFYGINCSNSEKPLDSNKTLLVDTTDDNSEITQMQFKISALNFAPRLSVKITSTREKNPMVIGKYNGNGHIYIYRERLQKLSGKKRATGWPYIHKYNHSNGRNTDLPKITFTEEPTMGTENEDQDETTTATATTTTTESTTRHHNRKHKRAHRRRHYRHWALGKL